MCLDLTGSIIQSSRDNKAAVSCLEFSGSRALQSPLHDGTPRGRLPGREQTRLEREKAPAGAAGETALQAEALVTAKRQRAGRAAGPPREGAQGAQLRGAPRGRRGPPETRGCADRVLSPSGDGSLLGLNRLPACGQSARREDEHKVSAAPPGARAASTSRTGWGRSHGGVAHPAGERGGLQGGGSGTRRATGPRGEHAGRTPNVRDTCAHTPRQAAHSPPAPRCLLPLSLLAKGSVQFSRSALSHSFDPVDCSTPGLPVHHQLRELSQTHVH